MIFFIDVGKHDADQPIFTLAAIHIPVQKEADLKHKVHQLKNKHRVQLEFLKTTGLWSKKDPFSYDLLKYLNRINAAFFIEVVDKKHYVVRNLVLFFLLYSKLLNDHNFKKYCFFNLKIHPHKLMMKIEDKLNAISTSELLIAYSECVKYPNYENLKNTFTILHRDICDLGNDRIDKIIVNIFFKAKDEFEKNKCNPEKFNDFVPPFDASKRNSDNKFAFVCNLTSFSNIYGRLNAYISDENENIDIIHDKQDQFDNLLNEYSNIIRESKSDIQDVLPSYSPLDYLSEREFSLVFSNDKEHTELQIADLIAGYMMRIVKTLSSNSEISSQQRKIARLFLNQNKKNKVLGVNFVAPTKLIRKINKLKR